MSVKSIIAIDVHDEAFKSFHELFQKYQAQLAAMPDGWRNVEKSVKSAGNSFSTAVDGARKLATQTAKAATSQHRFMNAIFKSTGGMKNLGKDAKTLAGHIWGATKNLMKWGSIAGIFTGIVGLGGFFGMDDLASDVLGIRKSSRGVGASIAQKQAFDTNYRPYVDPGFLGGVNAAASDVNKMWAFSAMGMRNFQSMSTTQLGRGLIAAIHTQFAKMPRDQIVQMMHARGLDQMGISLGEVLNIVRAKNLGAAEAGYFRDKRTMGLSSPTARAWTQFSVQLSRAGVEIRNVLVNGLTPLIPSLTRFSETMVSLAIKALPKVESALERFVTFLGSKQFQKDLKTFGHVLHDAAVPFEKADEIGKGLGYSAGELVTHPKFWAEDTLSNLWHDTQIPKEGPKVLKTIEKFLTRKGSRSFLLGTSRTSVTINVQPGGSIVYSANQLHQP